MTMMQGREAGVAEHHADDLLDELSQLRATDAQLREELIDVRRQRDEAISQAQWLILRVSNAEKAIEDLQAELAEARSNGVAPVEPAVVGDPVADMPPPVVADVVAEPVDETPASDVAEAEMFDADVPAAVVPSEPTPVAAVTPVAVVPGSWAGRVGPWLPPDEDAEDGSTAHEFAALTERALAVEAKEAEEAEAAAAAAPTPVEMNVLPEAAVEAKKPLLFRRR